MADNLTTEQVAEAQVRAQQEYYVNETRQLLEMAKMARANCLAASPQVEPVRALLYHHFMACARCWFKEPPLVQPEKDEAKQ